MTEGRIKLGVVGTNFVSDWLADSVAAVDGIECAAVYSRARDTGDDFSRRHGIDRVYTDFEAFLSSDIDSVYIASPNALHCGQAEAAMRAGKHVLCEKPAVTSVTELDRIRETARAEQTVFLEAMRTVHDPVMRAVRDSLGKIGTIRRAVFEFCQYSSRYDRYKRGDIMNAFDPKLGNAAVMDIGVYAIECAVMMFGEPLTVTSRSFMLPNGMEGMGKATLDYGEFDAEIVYSKIHDSVAPSYITGEEGSVVIGKISTGEQVYLRLRGEDAVPLGEPRPANNMIYEVEDFVRAVRGEIDTAEYERYTRTTIGIIDEIRRQNGIEFK